MPAGRRRRRRKNYTGFLLFAMVAAIGMLLYAMLKPASSPPIQKRLQLPTIASTLPSPTAASIPSPQSEQSIAPPQIPVQKFSPSAAPRLAIIIDDCGQWPERERAFIALTIPITLSVMPKERYTQSIAQEADAAGKGVMMHLPMEPLSMRDPGPGNITTSMTDAQIVAQVQDDLARVSLAKGVNNHEGSKATADERVMHDVVSVLAPAGLFFIDSRTSADSVAADVANEGGMRTASRDVFLDNVDSVDAVEAMLRHAADVARAKGSAIAIGHPRAATLEALQKLIPEIQARGIDFALASDLVHK